MESSSPWPQLPRSSAYVESTPKTGTSASRLRRGIVCGTPVFIAPEQSLGSDLDESADICATGCLAYCRWPGNLCSPANPLMPFYCTTPDVADAAELPIAPALDQLVLTCLAEVPAERSQSAR